MPVNLTISIDGWWYTYPSEKIWVRQLGWWSSQDMEIQMFHREHMGNMGKKTNWWFSSTKSGWGEIDFSEKNMEKTRMSHCRDGGFAWNPTTDLKFWPHCFVVGPVGGRRGALAIPRWKHPGCQAGFMGWSTLRWIQVSLCLEGWRFLHIYNNV